MRLSLETVNK